jgi:hypothetical protein
MTNTDLLPAVPSLSSSLSVSYSLLPDDLQRLFIKVFKYLWGVVHYRRFKDTGSVLMSLWAVDIIRSRCSLSRSELAILTFIYQMSNKNTKLLHSDSVYYSGVCPDLKITAKKNILSLMVKRGYVVRSYTDPSKPYLQRSFASRPVFLCLSSSGVLLLQGIEKDLYRLLLRSSLDDLTGKHKKA